jgi:hypothetical protein
MDAARTGDCVPTALDQPAQAIPTANMGWVNPPADVTNAIAALQRQCEAWPKTPIDNPLKLVLSSEDAICHAVTGHALFVPDELANSILQIGTFMVATFLVGAIVLAVFVGVVFRLWAKYFGPPRPPKPAEPPTDALTSVVLVIGWFGWLSASALVTQYSLAWGLVFMAATLMWIFITPHLVSLLRNKSD